MYHWINKKRTKIYQENKAMGKKGNYLCSNTDPKEYIIVSGRARKYHLIQERDYCRNSLGLKDRRLRNQCKIKERGKNILGSRKEEQRNYNWIQKRV